MATDREVELKDGRKKYTLRRIFAEWTLCLTLVLPGVFAHDSTDGWERTTSGFHKINAYTSNVALIRPVPLLVAARSAPRSVVIEPSGRFVYIADAGQDSVTQYAIGSTGELRYMSPSSIMAGQAPTSIAVTPSGRYAYVANGGSNSVSQYNIEKDGKLTSMNPSIVATENGPMFISVDPSGRFAYVANSSSNTISQYTIGKDGILSSMTPATIVTKSRPVSIAFVPSGQYMYVANDFIQTISQYNVGIAGTLTPMEPATVTVTSDRLASGNVRGAGPLSITVAPSGKYIYVVDGESNGVLQYTISTTGQLVPSGFPAVPSPSPSFITIDQLGRYAYVTNFGASVSQYTIGTDGTLKPMKPAQVTAGMLPICIAVDPAGRYAYIANGRSANISQYLIGDTGLLTPMVHPEVGT